MININEKTGSYFVQQDRLKQTISEAGDHYSHSNDSGFKRGKLCDL